MLREKKKHQLAFELYYALGDTRTHAEVSRRLKVSAQSLVKWARAFQWENRIIERDEIVHSVMDRNGITNAVEARTFQLGLTRATMVRWSKMLDQDAPVTAGEFIKAAQHELLLLGKATSRSEVISAGATNAAAAVILAAIDQHCPETCPKCAHDLGIKAALAGAIAQAVEALSKAVSPGPDDSDADS